MGEVVCCNVVLKRTLASPTVCPHLRLLLSAITEYGFSLAVVCERPHEMIVAVDGAGWVFRLDLAQNRCVFRIRPPLLSSLLLPSASRLRYTRTHGGDGESFADESVWARLFALFLTWASVHIESSLRSTVGQTSFSPCCFYTCASK